MKCEECGCSDLFRSSNEIICRNCGLVLDDALLERDVFVSEQNRASAKETILSKAGSFSPDGRIVKRTWLLSTKEKNLINIENQLELISSRLKLSDRVKKDALILFKKAMDSDLSVGRNGLDMICSCVYASCLMSNIPKTSEEIALSMQIPKRRLLRFFNVLRTGLNLSVTSTEPADIIPRFCSKLKLKPETVTKAIEISEQINGLMTGKQHKTISAVSIYLATKSTGDYRTQREVTNATGVLEVTLRKYCHNLMKFSILLR